MSLDAAAVRRYSRQIALPDVGTSGQERICAAEVVLVGVGAAIEAARLYLQAAGCLRVREVTPPLDGTAWLATLRGAAAVLRNDFDMGALGGSPYPPDFDMGTLGGSPYPPDFDMGTLGGSPYPPATASGERSSPTANAFDDDPMLRAAVHLGVPVIAMRVKDGVLDLLSFRHHGPCPHVPLTVPVARAEQDHVVGGQAVLAGTLAAAEALWLLLRPGEPPRARHLRIPVPSGGDTCGGDTHGSDPYTVDIPWAPECLLCGGHGQQADLS